MSKLFYKYLGKTEKWPQITGAYPASLTYNDVLMIPQNSKIESRSDVDTTVEFGPYILTKPIISAPMDTISGENMARELAKLGAIGTIPRGEIMERIRICRTFKEENIPAVYAVGLKNGFEEAKKLKQEGAQIVLVDVAHGGMSMVKDLAAKIKKELKLFVIAGNIVTFEEAKDYKSKGIDVARVGVGPGGLCKTRIVAGTGFPQLSAIFETTSSGIKVIADGGIREAGDFAKAIAAGASYAMIGSLFAGTDEAPGEVKNGRKNARGQASAEYMKDNGVSIGEFRSAEGISVNVKTKGPVSDVIDELMGGLRSAMTYAGAKNISDYQKNVVFSLISTTVNEENKPWLAEV